MNDGPNRSEENPIETIRATSAILAKSKSTRTNFFRRRRSRKVLIVSRKNQLRDEGQQKWIDDGNRRRTQKGAKVRNKHFFDFLRGGGQRLIGATNLTNRKNTILLPKGPLLI